MNTLKPLRLIRDFINYRIVYYWIDSQDCQVSPELEALPLAREWFIRYHFNVYNGTERRQSQIDRRELRPAGVNRRTSLRIYKRRSDSPGRRLTDQPVHVAKDLAEDKIHSIKQSLEVV